MIFIAFKFALSLLMNGRTGVSFMDTHLRQHFLILFLSRAHDWSVNPGLWVTLALAGVRIIDIPAPIRNHSKTSMLNPGIVHQPEGIYRRAYRAAVKLFSECPAV